MAVDAYQPCPCGSGKKFKFCCLKIADEMDKVMRLQEHGQAQAALQALDRLEREEPKYPWIAVARASLLLNEADDEGALRALESLLAREPDHTLAIVLSATAMLTAHGYAAAKPAVYKAYQKCIEDYPEMIAGLAMGIASAMLRDGRFMATRQHLAFAMRLVQGQDQQEVFVRLLEYDGDGGIPYPLRSVHVLADYTGSEERQKEARKATRMADIGCFEPAARLFTKLAEQEPERAELWQNAGFCRAWDGDQPRAAQALHEATRRHADFEAAVECETLAQLLDQQTTTDRVPVTTTRFTLQSVGRVLSKLDEQPRFARLDLPPPAEDEMDVQPSAAFDLLDRPSEPTGDVTLETVPTVLGQVLIFDEDRAHDRPATAFLTSFGDAHETRQLLLDTAAGDAEVQPDAPDEPSAGGGIPREYAQLQRRWHFTRKTPVIRRRQIEQQHWEQAVFETWPQTPLTVLGGKSPRDASHDDSLKLPLCAAVYVLDAFCERNRYTLDLPRLLRELRLPEPQPLAATDQLTLHTLSAMQLHRVPVQPLSDAQLIHVLNRALLIHHGRFLYEVLTEVLSRPACVEKIDVDRAYQTLSQLCRDRNRRDEALQWATRGRERARSSERPFEATLQWTMHELTLRLEDPHDPELRPLVQHIVQYYLPKLPQLQSYLTQLLDAFAAPFDLDALAGAAPAGATTPGGLWTPAGTADSGSAVKKLWLPGQD